MAHIYVYSPSGAVLDRPALRRGVKCLQALGHDVELDRDALARWQRFAGDDATRLEAVRRAAASGADVALITRGGYGMTRLLPHLPWSEISAASARGTRWLGFSDFTAFQLGLLAKESALSWAGPALCEGFGALEPDDITLACFEDMVQGHTEGTGWRLPATDRAALVGNVAEEGLLAQGAILWGGNLALVTALLGTPWWPDIDGGVLFLEDVGEHPYRIERMLWQLLHAGVLQRQQAVLLGQFTGFGASAQDRGFNLKQVVAQLRAQLSVPVLTALPFGHVPTKVLLPVGAQVDVLVQGREALLLWGQLPAAPHVF